MAIGGAQKALAFFGVAAGTNRTSWCRDVLSFEADTATMQGHDVLPCSPRVGSFAYAELCKYCGITSEAF